jgi:hypothetical protein
MQSLFEPEQAKKELDSYLFFFKLEQTLPVIFFPGKTCGEMPANR